jgi:hypothetical protein
MEGILLLPPTISTLYIYNSMAPYPINVLTEGILLLPPTISTL